MISFAGGLYVPVHHGVAASTDWTVIAGLAIVMAIAVAVVFALAKASAAASQVRGRQPSDSERRAA
jgi:hypothetical protein